MEKKIVYKDFKILKEKLIILLNNFKIILQNGNTNPKDLSSIDNILKSIKKYTLKKSGSFSYITKQTDNGIVISLFISNIEIKIHSSESDFYKEFGPLRKLNEIKEFHNIVNLIDYKTEDNYQYFIQDNLISFDKILCEVLKLNDEDFVINVLSNLLKAFFRLIFVLYLKNQQINFDLKLENFGTKYKNKNLKDISYFYFFGKDLILSENTSFFPKTESKFHDRRYLFKSFENFRKDLLIKIYECNKTVGIKTERISKILKDFFKDFDEIFTYEYESDRISEIGGLKIGDVKVFKFLNYDDILKKVKKLI